MKLGDLAAKVEPNGLFRTGQILAGEHSPANVRSQLNRWVRSGHVLRLRRGVYALVKPYRQAMAHPFSVANVLKKASYVSLQSALAYYGMIPEYVPVTTSVTTSRPEQFETPIGRFEFRHVTNRLFYGFSEKEVAPGEFALLADPYKALVDLLYLTPSSGGSDYLAELRLSSPEGFRLDEFRRTAHLTGSAKVKHAVERIADQWQGEVEE